MMPRPLVRRAAAFAEVGLEVSLMPSAALGMESLPPMIKVAKAGSLKVGGGDGVMFFGDCRVCLGIQDPGNFGLLSCAGMFPNQHPSRLNSLLD